MWCSLLAARRSDNGEYGFGIAIKSVSVTTITANAQTLKKASVIYPHSRKDCQQNYKDYYPMVSGNADGSSPVFPCEAESLG